MPIRVLCRALVVVLTVAASACDENLSDVTGPTPNLEPTFSSIQREIFNTADSSGRRACVQCHTNVGRNPAAGLNLLSSASYTALVGVASPIRAGAIRVIPGDPENSYLVHKLEGRAGAISGSRMPLGGPPFLTEGQILVIKRWIQLGARND
jgi:hypothetical protein